MSFFIRSSNFSKESGLFVGCFLDEFGIGQALSGDHCEHVIKPRAIVLASVIKSVGLLIKIFRQMRDITTHIGSPQGALKEAPIILNSVGMDIAPDIFGDMVNRLMHKFIHAIVGLESICVEICSGLHAFPDGGLQGWFLRVFDHLNFNLARLLFGIALEHAKNNGFSNRATSLYATTKAFPFVHVFCFPADVGFIRLYVAGEHLKRW
jgi:hypothetical protein